MREDLDCPDLCISGVIATFYDARTKLSREVLAKVKEFFGDLVFRTVVSKTVKFDEAASHHQTIFEYAPASVGARAYRNLALEVLSDERSPGG